MSGRGDPFDRPLAFGRIPGDPIEVPFQFGHFVFVVEVVGWAPRIVRATWSEALQSWTLSKGRNCYHGRPLRIPWLTPGTREAFERTEAACRLCAFEVPALGGPLPATVEPEPAK